MDIPTKTFWENGELVQTNHVNVEHFSEEELGEAIDRLRKYDRLRMDANEAVKNLNYYECEEYLFQLVDLLNEV
jgi:collagenase-like PrtC family protease